MIAKIQTSMSILGKQIIAIQGTCQNNKHKTHLINELLTEAYHHCLAAPSLSRRIHHGRKLTVRGSHHSHTTCNQAATPALVV